MFLSVSHFSCVIFNVYILSDKTAVFAALAYHCFFPRHIKHSTRGSNDVACHWLLIVCEHACGWISKPNQLLISFSSFSYYIQDYLCAAQWSQVTQMRARLKFNLLCDTGSIWEEVNFQVNCLYVGLVCVNSGGDLYKCF